jgi:hypothetical protein
VARGHPTSDYFAACPVLALEGCPFRTQGPGQGPGLECSSAKHKLNLAPSSDQTTPLGVGVALPRRGRLPAELRQPLAIGSALQRSEDSASAEAVPRETQENVRRCARARQCRPLWRLAIPSASVSRSSCRARSDAPSRRRVWPAIPKSSWRRAVVWVRI